MVGTNALGLLAKQTLAQDVELMPQGRILALGSDQLVRERGDHRVRGREIGDVGHAGMIREADLRYKIPALRDALVPAAPARLREIGACE